jgi:hypothetical protein
MMQPFLTRRSALAQATSAVLGAAFIPVVASRAAQNSINARPWIKIRGIYGGFPDQLLEGGKSPADFGFNAIWVGSGGLNAERIKRYHDLGLKVFAEFNSLHAADYLKQHPDAAPLGPDGQPSPPPDGWQGVSPFHAAYRQNRMAEFRRVLTTFDIDGIWLDYHHAHASWEQAEPKLPDTDFSPAALQLFQSKTGINLPADTPSAAKLLLSTHRDAWTDFRCGVLTDWVREYRSILNEVRPAALLGTFHCPWSADERDGAIRHKLAIDLPAQAPYLDILSIMPYHARFGHATDPAWISRQTTALAKQLKLTGDPSEKPAIWPIVQLADWGEKVTLDQIPAIIDHATRPPSTGLMVFHWSGISKDPAKIEALKNAYLQ